MFENELQCSLCCEDYVESGPHEPRVIPSCGHTYCLTCLDILSDQYNCVCPMDQRYFTCSPRQMPKNYALVTLINPKQVKPTRNNLTKLIKLKENIIQQIEIEKQLQQNKEKHQLNQEKQHLLHEIIILETSNKQLKQQVSRQKQQISCFQSRILEINQQLSSFSQQRNKSLDGLFVCSYCHVNCLSIANLRVHLIVEHQDILDIK